MESMVWNLVLSFAISILGWVLREKSAELNRVTILLNRTREEIAKEYVTKVEVHADINRVMNRLEVLDAKLDRLIESNHGQVTEVRQRLRFFQRRQDGWVLRRRDGQKRLCKRRRCAPGGLCDGQKRNNGHTNHGKARSCPARKRESARRTARNAA